MRVDIYLREKSGRRSIRFPILPEKIKGGGGSTVFVNYDIMRRGEVSIPTGTELTTWSWDSELPGALRKTDSMLRGTWKNPKIYDSILQDWKATGTKLNLMVIGYPINADVYIKDYQPTEEGAFGDIVYEIELVEARDITIRTIKDSGSSAAKRPAITPKRYTIKSGDTLWTIARRYYGAGSKWKTIYNANKTIIENAAKKRGRKSSSSGHWIYPGVTLTIP